MSSLANIKTLCRRMFSSFFDNCIVSSSEESKAGFLNFEATTQFYRMLDASQRLDYMLLTQQEGEEAEEQEGKGKRSNQFDIDIDIDNIDIDNDNFIDSDGGH